MDLIQCKGLSKTYGSGNTAVHALRGVDLAVQSGAFVAVVGASGSGKSTLLHLLASVDSPTAGSVQVGTGNANSGGSQNSGSNGSRTGASGSKAVKTGDSMFPIAGSAAVMALAAAVIVLGRRKRSIR